MGEKFHPTGSFERPLRAQSLLRLASERAHTDLHTPTYQSAAFYILEGLIKLWSLHMVSNVTTWTPHGH